MLRSIKCGKRLFFHIDFAAHLEHPGRVAAQHLRHVGDVRDVGGHVLAHLPIAARGGAHQLAILIAQRAREAVDLVLRGESHLGIGWEVEEPPHPPDELRHLLVGKGVVEAHHPHGVGDLGEWRCRDFVPHSARGRIRADQV
jgi:hypothetical protein